MTFVADILVGVVAVIHAAIAAVELLFWRKPRVHGRLGYTQEQADRVAPIVANAGLYNGFLAAGLVWGLLAAGDALAVKTFFLACAAVAGVFGALTLKPTTLVLKTLPAATALVAAWVSRSHAGP